MTQPEPALLQLDDRIIVITGAAGQLGQQFVRALIEHGARVVALDLSLELLEKLPAAPTDRLLKVAADVRRRPSLEAALKEITTRWDTPYGLINNAGLDSPPGAQSDGRFEEYPEGSWDQVIEVNLKGVFLCCQVFGGAMATAGRGSITNIGSIYGMVSPDQRVYEYRRTSGQAFYKPVAYSASKSALLNLTRYLATYWADQGVRVNTLTLAGVFNHQDSAFLNAYCQRIPIGRMARPDEYNGAIVFLCSDAAAYMTGANLVIDGGWTAW